MTKKYELTTESIDYYGKTLYRIKALKNFSDVKIGDLGGVIEKEDNLSHYGDCWVYHEAKVFGYAKVYDCARVNAGVLKGHWMTSLKPLKISMVMINMLKNIVMLLN